MIFPEPSIVIGFYFNTKKQIVAELVTVARMKRFDANSTIKESDWQIDKFSIFRV
ncbi:hypothetical protein AQPE_2612 [Aquipluma nitroreducens]|uniref:Uncharacterized protein n=1 Tax=Aquipluma nitroreducens TaxID=2010828 RepID=A0A5K7SA59_9BACT|nr:hypothetical protein AQPE_2612 [Aquipluma nitroreducens]